MARKQRNDVDYFPHSVSHGKKMFYLRSKYKNDGYTVWFMLLEELGKAEYHYLDLKDEVQLMYLSSEFMVTEDLLKEIINTLVKFEEFDSELWEQESIIFNEKFIENISDAYKKRNNNCIDKEALLVLLCEKGRIKVDKSNPNQVKSTLKGDGNTQSKVKDTKVKDTKVKQSVIFPFNTEEFKKQWDHWKQYKLKEFRFKYKSIESEQAALIKLQNLSAHNESVAIQIIHQSFANGWKGFFELKNSSKTHVSSNEAANQYERIMHDIRSESD